MQKLIKKTGGFFLSKTTLIFILASLVLFITLGSTRLNEKTPSEVFLNNTDASLPIKLLYFTGKYLDYGNILEWATTSEDSVDYFEVQRSTDGYLFKNIKHIKGSVFSNNIIKYEFLDNSFLTLKKDTLYYRLKQVYVDGSYKISNIIIVSNKKELSFNIYPDPSDKSRFAISITNYKNKENVHVFINDVFNREIYSNDIVTDEFGNANYIIDISKETPNGIYIIVGYSGIDVCSSKIVLNR